MFHGWQSFYQMTAEAAATLTGLMFVVATLTAGRQASSASQGARLFTTPTVFHLVTVLVTSGLALTADGEAAVSRAIMTGWASVGLAYAVTRAVGLAGVSNPTHWTDFWWYGAGPTAAYLALSVADALTWTPTPHAPYAVALCLLTLLVLTIRNAWDLVTWLAPRRDP